MARQASLMELRTLDNYGLGYPLDIAEAINYAAHNGAQVINLSMALPAINPNPGDVEILRRAVEAAQAAGALVVAASGNDSYAQVSYPAAFDGVLAVGASTQSDERASFSNYGDGLDLIAPGVGIFSTKWPSGNHDYGLYNGTGNGTSFASPHAAGVAALVRGLRPDMGQNAVWELVRRTADDVGAQGWDQQTGWGRLNACRAVSEAVIGLDLGLAANPPSVAVNGQTAIHLQITAPAPSSIPAGMGARVTLTTSSGTITPTVVTANSTGQAKALLLADPVTGTVQITATLGNVTATLPVTITSGVPVTLALTATPSRISSGGGQAIITVTVNDEGGSFVSDGTSVTFTTTLGSLAPLTTTTTAGQAATILTSGLVSGTAHVQAVVGGITGTVPVEIVGAGEPYSITLTATPTTTLVAGTPVTVTAAVFDGVGHPVADSTIVHFATDLGTLAAEDVTTTGGQASTQLLPGTSPGRAHVTAMAGQATGETDVSIMPGAAFTVTITANPPELTAGYNQLAALRAQVTDRYGNNVADGTRLDFVASLGQVSPAYTTTVGGVGEVKLVGELVAGTSQITATAAGGAQGYAQVQIHPATPASLTLDIAPGQIEVGGGIARLAATAQDAYGNAIADGTPVTFTTDLGELRLPAHASQAVPRSEGVANLVAMTANGIAEVELVSGQTPGTAHVQASVAPDLLATGTLSIQPGPPATLTLTVVPSQIHVGGRVQLLATVADQYSNPVGDGTMVRFGANRGTLDQIEVPTQAGQAATRLTVDQGGTGTISLVALSGDAFALGTLEVVPVVNYLPLILSDSR